MDPSGNIFSYCVGALALISTITSVLLYCQLYLPTSQLKHLDELLLETKSIYLKANDQRLLVPDVFAEAQRRLSICEDEYDRLREATYRAMTCIAILRALFQGQARRIKELSVNVKNLRAFLMTMSQQEKERKAEELRRTQDNLARGVDHASENTIVFNALPFIDAHDGSTPQTHIGLNQASDDQAVFNSRLSNFVASDGQRRNSGSTGSSLPILGWWSRKACQSEPNLPSYIVHGEFDCPPGTTIVSSTRSSTLVNEPAAASSVYPPSVVTRSQSIVHAATRWFHSAQAPNPEGAPRSSREHAVESSV